MWTYILDKRLSSENKSYKDRKTFQKAQNITEEVFAPIKKTMGTKYSYLHCGDFLLNVLIFK